MTDIAQIMARAMCAEQSAQMGEPAGCDACDSGECETIWLAQAALAALDKAGYVVARKRDIDGSHHAGCTCGYCA